MSEPILPLRQWPAGIQQASVPANDNALRVEAMERPCLGFANDASGTDADGDLWIVDSTPTGAFAGFDPNDLALYHVDPDTSTSGWYPWAPTDGLRLIVDGLPMIYVGGSTDEWQEDTSDGIPDAPSDGTGYVRKDGAWAAESGGGTGIVESIVAGTNVTVDSTDPANPIVSATGGGAGVAPVVTESGTSLTATGSNADNYTRFTNSSAKTYTFSDSETYTTSAEYHGRNVGAGNLTLTAGGTFALNAPAGGSLVIPPGGTFTVKIVGAAEADVFGVTVASP